jgi:hypothetical protein
MLVTYKGKKSGKTYSVPVGYVIDGDTVITTSKKHRVWWRSLRGGAGVTLRIKGKTYRAHAEVDESEEGVYEYFDRLFSAKPKWAKQFRVNLNQDGKPIVEEVARLSAESVIVTSKLQ